MKAPKTIVVLLFVVSQLGCLSVIRPSISPSEYLGSQDKIGGGIALYLSDALRNYESMHYAGLTEGKDWLVVLGPALADSLQYACKAKFSNVVVSAGSPVFPVQGSENIIIIIPEVIEVKQSGPLLLKFEQHHITITLRTQVFNREGKELKTITVTKKGSKAGSIGHEAGGHSAKPEAARIAIKAVVNETLEQISQIL